MNRNSAPPAWRAFPCSARPPAGSRNRATSISRYAWPRTFLMAALTISAGWKTWSSFYPNCSGVRWTWSKSRSASSVSKKRSTGIAPLPSEKPARRLEDIVENAQAAIRYTAGMDEAAFEENRLVYDAVERCLERISEAAAKLGELAPVLVPDQPWRDIRALGNRLRHDYDDISQDRLWDIVQKDLPSLSAACEDALRRLREG